eukprot:8913972-Pyramimonas_sp.AAC.1
MRLAMWTSRILTTGDFCARDCPAQCNAMRVNAMMCNAMQTITQHSDVQYSAAHHNMALQHCAASNGIA